MKTKKELALFNRGFELTPKRNVFVYGESIGKFHETLEIYENIKKRKIGIVYHYLLPANVKLLSSIEAVRYVKERTLEFDDESNFDLPMLVVASGIKVIGYSPECGYLNTTTKELNGIIIDLTSRIEDAAIIMPSYNMYSGIEDDFNGATVIWSKY